jgi:hypothetical protein
MRRWLLRVLLCALGLPVSLSAQTQDAAPLSVDIWGDLGLSVGTYGAWGAFLAFNRGTDSRSWRIRAHAQGNEGWTVEPGRTIRTFGEVAVMRGRAVPWCGDNWCGVYGGLSYVELSTDRPSQVAVQRRTAGLSGEILMVSARRPHLTIGVFANLNPVTPFAGFSLSVSVGSPPVTSDARAARRVN